MYGLNNEKFLNGKPQSRVQSFETFVQTVLTMIGHQFRHGLKHAMVAEEVVVVEIVKDLHVLDVVFRSLERNGVSWMH